jgi:ribosomal protein L37E
MKLCKGCGVKKPLNEFPKHPHNKDGHTNLCKNCTYEVDKNRKSTHIRQKEWRDRNKEKLADYDLRRRFDISLEEYDALLASQQGVCAICGRPEIRSYKGKAKKLSVDHDHTTGKIRGLLCYKCNLGIGQFEDSIKLLDKAKEYLTK